MATAAAITNATKACGVNGAQSMQPMGNGGRSAHRTNRQAKTVQKISQKILNGVIVIA